MSSVEFLYEGLARAVEMILTLDPYVISVTKVQLKVTGSAVLLSVLFSIPLAAFISFREFLGKRILIILIDTCMGLPPVVVGLVVFIFFISSGPLGFLGLFYTPAAMATAQFILATPIITGVTIAALSAVGKPIRDTAISLGATRSDVVWLVIREAKFGILTAILAGFGRAIAEVGAILIAGGNIVYWGGESYTRTLSTAIVVEADRGDIAAAIAFGIILLTIAFSANMCLNLLKRRA
jgi:tungstate transport system permease protein